MRIVTNVDFSFSLQKKNTKLDVKKSVKDNEIGWDGEV
jgi:hypothetical protein